MWTTSSQNLAGLPGLEPGPLRSERSALPIAPEASGRETRSPTSIAGVKILRLSVNRSPENLGRLVAIEATLKGSQPSVQIRYTKTAVVPSRGNDPRSPVFQTGA